MQIRSSFTVSQEDILDECYDNMFLRLAEAEDGKDIAWPISRLETIRSSRISEEEFKRLLVERQKLDEKVAAFTMKKQRPVSGLD
jgi:hypothetical protein